MRISFFKSLWAIFLPFCFFGFSLMAADWSMPPKVIYPLSAPLNAKNPSIATDGHGNSVAVWIDTTNSGSMHGATLASGAVNGSGQPDWILTEPVNLNVNDPFDGYLQAVGVDFDGNATAAWTDGTYVYVSTLIFGESTWSIPEIINIPLNLEQTSNVYIVVARDGKAVVTWLSSPSSYESIVFANIYNPELNAWGTQTDVLNGSIETHIGSNPIAINSSGNVILPVRSTSDNSQAVRYKFDTDTWTQIFIDDISPTVWQFAAIDTASNSTIVWSEADNKLYGATLPSAETSFTNQTTLSVTVDLSSCPLVTVDEAGNAVAIWSDTSGAIGAARFSLANQTWSNLPLLDLEGNIAYNLSLSGDSRGNVLASWTITLDANSYISTAALSADSSSWTFITQLSPDSGFSNNSRVVLTTAGDGVAIWEDDSNSEVGTINSSIFLDLYPDENPLPAAYFTGKVIKNKFLTQTNRINNLQWKASPDPSVVAYRLFRNSKFLALIPAIGEELSYNDNNRKSKVRDTYQLVSLNAEGLESTPLYVTLP